MKLVINPAYTVKQGTPTCNHNRRVYKLGNLICEFCDECGVVWIRKEGDSDG